jgi:hypothetical protein
MATTTTETDRTAALEEIHVADNVRALDADHVHALAGSIRLQGILVPVVVRPAEGDVVLADGSLSSSQASIGWPPQPSWAYRRFRS